MVSPDYLLADVACAGRCNSHTQPQTQCSPAHDTFHSIVKLPSLGGELILQGQP
jgi:hypothetical protein